MVMPVICYLVSPRGFCSGVNRAVNMAEQILKLYKKFYITEDIIHNKMFMSDMIAKGAIKVSSVDEIPDGNVIMFSAHGVSPQVVETCEAKGLTIIDGTCPVVKTIQRSIKRNSLDNKIIILIGNRYHPEIIGMLGYAADNTKIFVVSNEEDVALLPDMSNLEAVYYTQTTLDRYRTTEIINAVQAKIPHVKSESENNICYATMERQSTIKNITDKIELDLVIVVGSATSSNTTRLVEIAKDSPAKNVIRIDSKDELNTDILPNNIRTIAITSGASVPNNLVDEVILYIREIFDEVTVEEICSTIENNNK